MKYLKTYSAIFVICLISCTHQAYLPPATPKTKAEIDALALDSIANSKLRHVIKKELLTSISSNSNSPISIFPFQYYTEVNAGSRHPRILRNKLGKREIFVDLESILLNFPHSELGIVRISPTHDKIAFTVDLMHTGAFSLFIWNHTRSELASISNSDAQDLEWSGDGRRLFFTIRKNGRPTELWVSECSELVRAPNLIMHEPQEEYALRLHAAGSENFIYLSSESEQDSKIYLIETLKYNEKPIKLAVAPEKAFSTIYKWGEYFVLRTNDRGPNFRLVLLSSSFRPIRELVRHNQETAIEDVQVFSSCLILWERHQGHPQLEKLCQPQFQKVLFFADLRYSDLQKTLNSVGSTSLRFIASGPNQPKLEISIDLSSGLTSGMKILGPTQAKLGQTSDYAVQRTFCKSKDGTQVPMMILKAVNHPNPSTFILNVYGAYGAITGESYNSQWQPLLKREAALAVAHVRGSGYFGPSWHFQGTALNKLKSLEDFEACAEKIRSTSSKAKLVAYGRSAGGLIVASSIQRRPDLFDAAILDVPFLNPLASLLDPTSPLRVREFAEWGNPYIQLERENIIQYSPYPVFAHQGKVPQVLILSSTNDRVLPYQIANDWADMLRLRSNKNVLVSISESATHQSSLDQAAEADETSLWQAFALN